MPRPLSEEITTHYVICCAECNDTTDDDLDLPIARDKGAFAVSLYNEHGWRYMQGPPGSEEGWYCGGCVKELIEDGFVVVEAPVAP